MKRIQVRLVSMLLSLVLLLGLIPATLIPASADIIGSEIATSSGAGDRWLKQDTYYDTEKATEGTPLTFEAVIKRPNSGDRSSAYMSIFSSYVDESTPSITFGLNGARANVTVIDAAGKKSSVKMINYTADNTCGKKTSDKISLYSTKYVHVAYVLDPTAKTVSLYVGGGLAGTYALDFGELPTDQLFRLGGDFREENSAYYDGAIHMAAVYNAPRSAEQIAADYALLNTSNVLDYEDETLIAAWDLSKQGENGCRDRSGNGCDLSFHAGVGMRFDTYGPHKIPENLSDMPETVEAWIYLPDCYSRRGGTILGNYAGSSSDGSYFGFEINYSGAPRFFYSDGTNVFDYKFENVDLRNDAWTHIAWVHDVEGGAMRFYVNGVEAQAISSDTTAVVPFPEDFLESYCHVGGDKQKNGAGQRFNAFVKELRVYSDVRTAEEIAFDYKGEFNYTDDAFILHYEMEPEDIYGDLVDLTGKGNTAVYEQAWWDEVAPPPADYAYSFAIVGDTQRLAWKQPAAFANLYAWIADNVEAKKMKYVIGLGDITETNTDEEWTIARDAIKQIDGKVPYSLIWGAYHDSAEKFNEYFGENATDINYTQHVDGYMTAGDISNTYHEFTVGTQPYLILCLETGAQDHILEWAAGVIDSHPEHRVIITTHAYLQADGTFLEAGESSCATSYDKNNNNGDDLWEKLFSKHENIYMVLCGHMSADEVVIRKSIGDHGNEVTEILVDPQSMDAKSTTAMVAMLYFSEDGKNVHVEYYSTHKNQWKPNKSIVMENVLTSDVGGAIPEGYESVTEHPFVAFLNGKFVGSAKTWAEANTLARKTLDANNGATVYVLLRDDATIAAAPAASDRPYLMNGTALFDLGGHTLTVDARMFSGNVEAAYAGAFDTSIVVKNGTVLINKEYLLLAQNKQTQGEDKVFNFTFENVIFIRNAVCASSQTFYAGNNVSPTKNNYFNFTFNDCTFDYADTAMNCNLLLLNKSYGITTVKINGGHIVAPKAYKLTLANLNSNGSFTLGKGSDGKYPTLTLPAGVAVTDRLNTNSFINEDGYEASFGGDGVASEGFVTYSLLAPIETVYGTIPAEYADASAYPIVAFANGEFAGAATKWSEIGTVAKNALVDGVQAVTVLLRDDISNNDGIYFYGINGTVEIDLGGHTVTVKKILLRGTVTAEYQGDYETSVVMKNGTLVMDANYIFFSQNKQVDGVDKVFNFTFEHVTFKRGAYTGNQTFYAGNNDNPTKNNYLNFVFNGCTFDYSESAAACYLFNFNKDKVFATVTINGGSVKGPASTCKLTLGSLRSGSTVAFGKNSDGNYTTLTLPSGVETPTDSFSASSFNDVSGEKMTFVKSEGIYKLVPSGIRITGAYLNLASDVSVLYSASVPADYENPYMVFEFCGKSYTVREYTVAADGEILFAFEGVTPQMIGENIKATLFATKGGEETSVEKAEYSVLAYCKSMLAKTDDEALKTLLSDLLVYGAASQVYTGYKADTLVTEGLDLTPSTFDGVTESDKALFGTADARVSWKGVALRYENAMAMKLNFKADASLTLKVAINGRVFVYTAEDWETDANGNSVVYFRGILAGEYGDVVTACFYDGDVQVGQYVIYSVNSYVYSMQENGNGALAALVQATYNYGASAEDYAGK